jgi:eukaryotic-like serine/threonine-protein kinase
MIPFIQATSPAGFNLLQSLQYSFSFFEGTLERLDPSSVVGILVALLLMAGAIKLIRNAVREARVRTLSATGVRDVQGLSREARRHKRQGNYQEAGRSYEVLERYDEAIQMYTKAKAYRPLGVLYERQRNWGKAAIYYDLAQDYEKSGEMALHANNFKMAGEAYLKNRMEFSAAEAFEKGRDYQQAAMLYEKNGYLARAASCFEKSQELLKAAELYERHYLQEKVRTGTSAAAGGTKPQERIESYALQSGRLYLQSGEVEKAAGIFGRGGFLKEAADAYLGAKQAEKAAELYQSAKEFAKAIELYRQLGLHKKAASLQAELFSENGDYAEAARMSEKAEEYGQAGDLYEKANDLSKAGEMFMKAKEFVRASEVFLSASDERKAATALEQAKRHEEAAALYRKLGEFATAARLLEEAGEFYQAGVLYHKLGRLNETIESLQRVESQSQNYFHASVMLGKVFVEQGMLDAAKERYKKLLSKREVGPETLEPYYHLAMIFEHDKESSNALKIYDKILAEDYNYKDVRSRVERLKKAVNLERQTMQKMRSGGSQGTVTPAPSGRYRRIRKVGQGGMGVVFQAEDTILHRNVAYKMLPQSLKDHPKVLENFLQEARVAAAINHPNIVTIYDTGRDEEGVFITMEFVEGVSLKDLLDKANTLPVTDFLDIAKQICQGLDFAHSRNVIHRDIKPANIMVSRDKVIKIMDFGLAKILTDSMLDKTSVKGTPLYMAPEQIRGEKVDHRADIYALGCTFYRMVAGRPPFVEGDVYYHHLHSVPTPPRTLNPTLPEQLDQLIMKCLEKDRIKRYQRIKEILEELEAVRT